MKDLFSLLAITAMLTTSAQWTILDSGTLIEFDAVMVDDAQTYWVGGEGILMKTTNGGDSWTTFSLPEAGDIEAIMRLDQTTILFAADDGVIGRSTDNGETWALIDTQAPNVLYDLTHVGDQVWASGRDGGLVHSSDQGLTWTLQTSGTTERIHGIAALDAMDLVAVGREGVLLNTSNGGTTWTLSSIAGGDDGRAITFLDNAERTGLIAGPAGEILRSTDQGITWTSVSFPSLMEAQAFGWEDAGVVYAVGDNALILVSTDQGQTWETMTTMAISELSGVDVKDGVAVAVGANGTILKLDADVAIHSDRSTQGDLTIYPNPSTGPVNIELSGIDPAEGKFTLEVLTSDGKLVDRTNWPVGKRKAYIEQLDPGQYIIRLMAASGVAIQRTFVVVRP